MYQIALLFSPFCGVRTVRFLLPWSFFLTFSLLSNLSNIRRSMFLINQIHKTEIQCNSIIRSWEVVQSLKSPKTQPDPTRKAMEPSKWVECARPTRLIGDLRSSADSSVWERVRNGFRNRHVAFTFNWTGLKILQAQANYLNCALYKAQILFVALFSIY